MSTDNVAKKSRRPRSQSQPNRHRRLSALPTLAALGTGEPDANAEAATAKRRGQLPLYIDGFVNPPNFDFQPFENGEKFLLIGQKGTGKTALLRNIQRRLEAQNFLCEYIIFRDTIQNEEGLVDLPFDYMIQKSDLQNTPIYQHCIKRIILTSMLNSVKKHRISFPDVHVSQSDQQDSQFSAKAQVWLKSFIGNIMSSPYGQTVSLVADSIIHDQSIAQKLLGLTEKPTATQIRSLLKRLNDRLMDYCVDIIRRNNTRIAVFLDEIHFQYSSEDAIRDDAYLVRDVINAAHSINSRFIEEELSGGVYLSIRSEYLSHPIIAQAELAKTIASFSHDVDWSTLPYTKNHPIFEVAVARAAAALAHYSFTGDTQSAAQKIIDSLFSNYNKIDFLEFTWGKPRDIVWFFKKVTSICPDKRTLSISDFNACLRAYALDAWAEMKSGLSSYLSEVELTILDDFLKRFASISLERGKIGDYNQISAEVRAIFIKNRSNLSDNHELTHLMDILYMLGLYYTKREEKGKEVFDRFHRGQNLPNRAGEIVLHRLVAKAFS